MEFLKDQAEIERISEDILTEQQLIIDYDRRRNENREALGCFRRGEAGKGKREWFFAGGLFLKLPNETAKHLLEEDQKKLNADINRLRDSIKTRVTELEKKDRGNTTRLKGFELTGVTQDELSKIARHDSAQRGVCELK
ncbi:p53 and DNA damage-regulated protein 1 [Borealophlyctis nickersoniae]|nr:p53 and DNA damage-regulated protein 1 [Borealophlyctis nickersoniae]